MNWEDVLRLANRGNLAPSRMVVKTSNEWRAQLSPEAFEVTRRQGTQAPYSSELCHRFAPGRYACVCCGEILFDATTQFESGSGWPSFTAPFAPNAIAYTLDSSLGMTRVETTCNVCEAHLGHVFPDGPAPSGLRYCINGVALRVVEPDANA